MSLTNEQITALLRPINPRRVLHDNKGMSHVSQQDVRAHLTRIFGFGGWDLEVRDLTCVAEGKTEGKNGWAVTYRAMVRLTVKDPSGQIVASFDDVGTGTSPNLPTLGDGHDFAAKVAVSMALKRAATNLGDGFGLSLYNKGQTDPLVIGTLVMPEGADVQDQVPAQVDMGHEDGGSSTLDTAGDSPPSPEPVEPSPASGDAPASDSLPEAGATPVEVAAQTAAQVEMIRDRVHEAMQVKPNQQALMKLTRINLDAGNAGLMQQMTTMPTGEPVTVAVLIDSAIKLRSRSA